MSHELRTPLNAIIGFSDVQRREMFGPVGHERYRQYATDIHASGTHLLDLITTILDISKAEAGKLEVIPVDLDPQSVLDSTLLLIRGAAETKRIHVSVERSEAPLTCLGRPASAQTDSAEPALQRREVHAGRRHGDDPVARRCSRRASSWWCATPASASRPPTCRAS